eukprot:CAMPEP_0202686920 /NCGR_PEP_ID=MMETSP1385-20130828/2674_1 /ASSEMBLY_ACC=CAM_ASM_000861 /TAXON_ID=933848 /ORGANISM="Elphidium margaritaceum" /LENGTH=632 /DNA_ID=CAMNT_0049341601 /DNA_START=80 /DNA_END=1978 /DNA_ORIENTATION=-
MRSLCILLGIDLLSAFYLPGIKPHEYAFQEQIKIKVNKLDSILTQLPYDHYALPFCPPTDGIRKDAENLGEILSGDTIENSPYKVEMMLPTDCVPLCKKTYSKKDLHHFATKIDEKYRVNLIVDNLPAAQKFKTIVSDGDKEMEDFIYEKGYPLGYAATSNGKKLIMLNNHIDLVILYHDNPRYEGNRIVGFEVQPRSIAHDASAWNDKTPEKTSLSCSSGDVLRIANPSITDKLDVVWSYSVLFEPSEIQWASRWDPYLKMQDPQIHWFSILNSFMIVIFLSGMVAMILMRALHKDLRRYNSDPEELEQAQEESGWKLVHGDVFRTPENPSLFACLVGTGVQVFVMCLLTLVFAALGFLSPANRGSLMTTLLLMYVFMGIFAGYFSARCYKMFGETNWQKQTLLTALLYPSINFAVFFVLNLLVWHEGSSGAVPFGTMFSLLILWFGISVPLVYLGAYFGFKKPVEDFSCPTNELLRMIPQQPWYMQRYFAILVGGVLPFGAVFIEVFFIMSSIWLHHYYYMFGFLLLVFFILILTSAEITVVMTYFQLCAEDWRWWWRSVLTSGAAAVYLFFYSVMYFYTKLDIVPFVSSLLYFGYMFLVSLAFFIVTGTVGFYATYRFVVKIYDAIKIE